MTSGGCLFSDVLSLRFSNRDEMRRDTPVRKKLPIQYNSEKIRRIYFFTGAIRNQN